MKKSSPNSERMAGVTLVGLLLGALVIGAIWFYHHKMRESNLIPIEEAMYVTDWDIRKIYGPGTPEQARIVKQFRSRADGKLEFNSPVLYRMSGSANDNSGEGILLFGFDPKHPEMALHLKAAPSK